MYYTAAFLRLTLFIKSKMSVSVLDVDRYNMTKCNTSYRGPPDVRIL